MISEETRKKIKDNHAKYWSGKHMSLESNKKRSDSLKEEKSPWYGKSLPDEMKQKISKSHLGKKQSLETKKKISETLKGKKKNRVLTEDFREKRRNIRLKEIEKKFGGVNFNVKACKFIDSLNKGIGINLQHALNGGEKRMCGYSVDGYDKERNIIFEYDEPHHYYVNDGKLKPRDTIRQERIIQKINPLLFIRYNERNQTLYDSISNQTLEFYE